MGASYLIKPRVSKMISTGEKEGCFPGASLVRESYRAWSCFSLSLSERAPEQDAGGWSAECPEKHQNTK